MSALRERLHAFAAHLRDPAAHPPPPGIEARRLAVYRELFINNIRSLLASGFPVIRKTLGDDAWDALVRDFHARHRARTPLFTEIGQEFVAFVRGRETEGAGDPPWLPELAHYEWVELALQIADAQPPPHDRHGDLITGVPVRSPLAWPLAYRWPVHAIGPGHIPDVPGPAPTLLLVRRDAMGVVRFSELSALVYRLLELLDDEAGSTGHQVLSQLADEAQADDRDGFVRQGAAMLLRLREEGTVMGTRPRAEADPVSVSPRSTGHP